MEIRGYVSTMRWRLVILVLFPLVAGTVAYLLLADTPEQHRAETILTVPSSVTGGPSSGSVAQYMANFEQAIVSDPVVTEVATTLGADRDEVRAGLEATQLGGSNLVRVSYQGTEDAARVVELGTRAAFELVSQIQLPFGQSLDVLQAGVRSARSQLGRAEQRLDRFLLENGVVLPREEYLMAASTVSALERQIVEARAVGSPTEGLEIALAEGRTELTRLAAVLPAYGRLQAAVDRATEDMDAAEDELQLAQEQSIHLAPQMSSVAAQVVPRIRTVGKGVGIAAAAGLIAALALLFLFPSRSAFSAGRERDAVGYPARP